MLDYCIGVTQRCEQGLKSLCSGGELGHAGIIASVGDPGTKEMDWIGIYTSGMYSDL
jgi:hypothetical protein